MCVCLSTAYTRGKPNMTLFQRMLDPCVEWCVWAAAMAWVPLRRSNNTRICAVQCRGRTFAPRLHHSFTSNAYTGKRREMNRSLFRGELLSGTVRKLPCCLYSRFPCINSGGCKDVTQKKGKDKVRYRQHTQCSSAQTGLLFATQGDSRIEKTLQRTRV